MPLERRYTHTPIHACLEANVCKCLRMQNSRGSWRLGLKQQIKAIFANILLTFVLFAEGVRASRMRVYSSFYLGVGAFQA